MEMQRQILFFFLFFALQLHSSYGNIKDGILRWFNIFIYLLDLHSFELSNQIAER